MHPRRQILKRIKARLTAEQAFLWVRNTRLTSPPAVGNNYPGITFYALSEQTTTETIHGPERPQTRQLEVDVSVWLQPNSRDPEEGEAQADHYAELVEQIMVEDEFIAGVDDVRLVSTNYEFSEDEPSIHRVILGFQIDYNTMEGLVQVLAPIAEVLVA
jgi:hypothetical protein